MPTRRPCSCLPWGTRDVPRGALKHRLIGSLAHGTRLVVRLEPLHHVAEPVANGLELEVRAQPHQPRVGSRLLVLPVRLGGVALWAHTPQQDRSRDGGATG